MYIGFTGIILVTVLYKNSPLNNSPINSIKINFDHHENLINTPLPRILCLILTSPKNFLSRTRAINETWAPRCDRYFFITEHDRKTLKREQIKFIKQVPIARIKNITAGYDHLTQKSTLAFLFAYEYHLNDFEWFVKADDDTYLFVDHLKTFLSEQNSSEPVTFGYNFKVIIILKSHN
jgi:glycoprotein-N-acetylgalactosamine 3-beta-galactosyltransferase